MAEDIWAEKPDEKDPKYSFGEHPTTGLPQFNSVYFLTDMDDWLAHMKGEWDELIELYRDVCMGYAEVCLANNELKEKAELVDILEDEITRRQEDTRLWLKLQERLEAIKKFVEEGPQPKENTLKDWQQAVDDWLCKLMSFLEAEA